ncbi:hypothetical protein [Methylomonas koyamae]|nr:hypothetical protein [Methylomonas koyamae]BBL60847.1 hypothetical protein MKFW12EY_44600 [Methylomonas koyamae]
MIFSRRLHIRVSLVLILTVLSHFGLNPALYSGEVWCFGEDGHVAMESANHHHDHEFSHNVKHSVDETGQMAMGKSHCTDIAYPNAEQICNIDPIKDFSKHFLNDWVLALGAILFILSYLCPPTFRLRYRRHRHFVDSGHLALRSIVLLN